MKLWCPKAGDPEKECEGECQHRLCATCMQWYFREDPTDHFCSDECEDEFEEELSSTT